MLQFFALEKFTEIKLHETLQLRYAISNYGRLISFKNEFKDGKLLKGGTINGYRIFRYKIRENNEVLNKHKFFYRMVAENFLPVASEDKQYVLHLDFNLANDFEKNLRWANKEEMLAHQSNSPKVQESRKKLAENNRNRDGFKLNAAKVKIIKRKLADPNRKTRIKMLAKQFGVSEMQLYRIKSGENWGHVSID